MPRLPRITARDTQRAIERDGWYPVPSVGGHRQFRHPTKPGRVTIPAHGSTTIKVGTLKRIIAQAGLTVDELIALL